MYPGGIGRSFPPCVRKLNAYLCPMCMGELDNALQWGNMRVIPDALQMIIDRKSLSQTHNSEV